MISKEDSKREKLLIESCMRKPDFRSLMIMLLSELRPKYKGSDMQFISAAHHRNAVIDLIEDKLKESPLEYLEMKLQQQREEHDRRISK